MGSSVSDAETVGLIGAGHIAAALVTGWRAGGDGPPHLLLSPRNADIAQQLAQAFPQVAIAADNQAVLDRADTVLLCVRPQIAEAVLRPLRFAGHHRVLSLIATFPLARLAPLLAPAGEVARAVPMPFASSRRGPLAVFPPHDWALTLMAPLGDIIAAPSEPAFDHLCAITATMSAFFKTLGTMSGWLAGGGVPRVLADHYVASQILALSQVPGEQRVIDFAALAVRFATKGGINEQVTRELTEAGAFDLLTGALDRVLLRVRGEQPLPADRTGPG
jgi:pyrroline-5-carboxylate reductase